MEFTFFVTKLNHWVKKMPLPQLLTVSYSNQTSRTQKQVTAKHCQEKEGRTILLHRKVCQICQACKLKMDLIMTVYTFTLDFNVSLQYLPSTLAVHATYPLKTISKEKGRDARCHQEPFPHDLFFSKFQTPSPKISRASHMISWGLRIQHMNLCCAFHIKYPCELCFHCSCILYISL